MPNSSLPTRHLGNVGDGTGTGFRTGSPRVNLLRRSSYIVYVIVVAAGALTSPFADQLARAQSWPHQATTYGMRASMERSYARRRNQSTSYRYVPRTRYYSEPKVPESRRVTFTTGDTVVARRRAPVQLGTEVLAYVDEGTSLTVQGVQGDWAAVDIIEFDRIISGWICADHLIHFLYPIHEFQPSASAAVTEQGDADERYRLVTFINDTDEKIRYSFRWHDGDDWVLFTNEPGQYRCHWLVFEEDRKQQDPAVKFDSDFADGIRWADHLVCDRIGAQKDYRQSSIYCFRYHEDRDCISLR